MKVSKHNAKHYIWGDGCDGWHLVQDEKLSIIHERMPADTAEVRHYHEKSRQFFFVLSGTATLEVDGVEYILNSQEGKEVQSLVPHQMLNKSDKDVEFLVTSQPPSKGDRILVEHADKLG